MRGIQNTVYQIIKTSRENGSPFMTTHDIIEECKKTSLGEYADQFVSIEGKLDMKYPKINAKVWQALLHLKNKDIIKNVRHGRWTVVVRHEKYVPKPCKALVTEHKISCTNDKCDWYTLIKSNNKPKRQECPVCGKKTVIEFNRFHCPIFNKYIADPNGQCELHHTTDVSLVNGEHGSGMVKRSMKPCYFNKKPGKPDVDYIRKKMKILAEKHERELIEDMEHT